MVDNAEWNSGENSRFGIQYVNYTSLERHYKRSAMALCESPFFALYDFLQALNTFVLAEFYAAHKSQGDHRHCDDSGNSDLCTNNHEEMKNCGEGHHDGNYPQALLY